MAIIENREWLDNIEQNASAYDSFLRWIEERKLAVRLLYKEAKTWEDTLRIQGQEKELDNILHLSTIDSKEERRLKEYRKQTT